MLEDKRLVWKLKRGDAGALRRIYEKYRNTLLTVAVSLLNETAVAKDILHDVFVSFAEDVESFHLYGSLKNHLITCVVNRVRDRFRSEIYQMVEINQKRIKNSDADHAETLLAREQPQFLIEALAELPEHQREVVILHLQGGMKFREIAEMQHISINTTLGRYRYGLDKLSSILNRQVAE